MRLIAHISEGKLCVRPLSSPFKDPKVSVSFDEKEKLVGYFADLVKTNTWDGHVMCSSSMDFANEEGWPEPEAREYLDECVIQALEQVRKERSN